MIGALRPAATAAALATGLLLSLPAAVGGHSGHFVNIDVRGDFLAPSFSPARVTAYVTDPVVWTWRGPTGNHSVTADAGQAVTFDSDPAGSPSHETGDTFQHIFRIAGEFTYHCKVHPSMTGVISVVPLPGQAPRISSLEVAPASACSGRRCRRPRAIAVVSKNSYLEGRIERRLASGRWRRVRFVGPAFARRGRNSIALPTRGLPAGRYRVIARVIDNLNRYSRSKRAEFRLVNR